MTFPANQLYCILDYETFSESDLKKAGAYEYSMHESTDIICVAWKIGTRAELPKAPVKSWSPLLDDTPSAWKDFGELASAMSDEDFVFVAHNAFFEQMITRNVHAHRYIEDYTIAIPPKRWVCTAALGRALALPGKLEHLAKVLKSPIEKDMQGHRLMLKWSKPRKPTKNNPSTRHSDPAELQRIIDYCRTDILAEEHAFLNLPPLSPTERKLWCLDQRINMRGIKVDRPLIKTVRGMIKDELEMLEGEAVELIEEAEAEGLYEEERAPLYEFTSLKQRDFILEFVRKHDADLPDLKKDTVAEAINSGLVEGRALAMLQLRQKASLTSIAKYPVLALRSGTDGRVRDNLIYHTTSTGRWGGVGVQFQNLPRGTIKNTLKAARDLATGDLELVRMLHGDPMQVFSSCIRNMIIAPPGKVLHVADYSQIEVRVLFWVAGDEAGMNAFRQGRDLYKEMASKVFSIPIDEIDDESFERFIGKTLELGCGYNMGGEKFVASCALQGREVPLALGKKAVNIYREAHPKVKLLWSVIERAAISAVQNPGRTYSVNRTKWFMEGRFLWCELPSGRRLAYADPTLKMKRTPWGEMKPTLYHWGVDSIKKKWVNAGTYGGKLVENVVQAIARDLMASAMLRLEATKKWKIVLTVHDELVTEAPLMSSVDEFVGIIKAIPEWALGCPIDAKGWEGTRYKK